MGYTPLRLNFQFNSANKVCRRRKTARNFVDTALFWVAPQNAGFARKKAYKLLAGLVLMGLFSSCSFLASDTEALLRPPTLNKRQAEVYAALEINPDTIVYKYPQQGQYRSPYIFYDMDGDGKEEAAVFYSNRNTLTETRTKLLRQEQNGSWVPFKDFAVSSDQVDFVQFARMLSTDSSCMIIGWKNTVNARITDSFFGIYSFTGDTFHTEVARQPYTAYIIHDFGGDGLDEAVVINRDETQAFRLSLIRGMGQHIAISDTLPLSAEADSILKITVGRLWDNAGAVYIDHLRIDASVATEVIRVDGSGLSAVVSGEPIKDGQSTRAQEDYLYTYRDQEDVVLCQDVDGDGVVEVPYPIAMPGNMEDSGEIPLRLTQLMHLTPEGFTIVSTAAINKKENYLVYYPEKWINRVTVVQDEEPDEWKFYAVDPESGERIAELLRIQAGTIGDQSNASDAESIPLKSRGARKYTGYIPRAALELPSITKVELEQMFLLLNK